MAMRIGVLAALFFVPTSLAAELESRVLTTYLSQDMLETAVRTEGWTEVPLPVKGGVRKGDVVRLWAGGLIDRGNGEQPGKNANPPSGPGTTASALVAASAPSSANSKSLALSGNPAHRFALLVKTESLGPQPCLAEGKPLELKLTKEKERLWIGFNDEKGRYQDNHLGRGKRHEWNPLWIRLEVVRIIVD